jgi:hypothetical protein
VRAPAHPRARRAAVGALLLALTLGPVSAASAAGSGGDDAYIRVAHLVPGFGGVTMTATLTGFDGSTRELTLAPEATYGAITGYEALPAGSYAVAVRPLGAAASTAPVLTQTLQAQAGDAYTIAGLGDSTAPRLSAIQDDLSAPSSGTARVRVLPAAEPGQTTDVTVDSGTRVASGAEFSVPTGYVDVPAGPTTFTATTGQRSASDTTTLAGGSVYTVLVLADGTSGLELRPVRDATGSGVVPAGGAAAGGGYLAERASAGTSSPASAVAGTALAGAAFGGALLLVRRRTARRAAAR